jgi:hypothetical protein
VFRRSSLAVFDGALSRSKLEAIVSVGLWVPVGAGHARDAFFANARYRGHGLGAPAIALQLLGRPQFGALNQ